MTPTPDAALRPESTDPREARRRGMRSLRIATAAVGTAAVVGTGGITLAVAEPPAPASGLDSGTPAGTSTEARTAATAPPAPPPGEAGLQPPAQAPEPVAPGNADASSGGS